MKNLNVDKSWTLFLDRDGVINERIFGGYVTSADQFKFLPGVLEFLKEVESLFGKIVVVTNQQGVAKGLMSERNLNAVHEFMIEEIHSSGGRIDKVYAATNLKGAEVDRRKPNVPMALEAKRDFDIDFERSIMVGDTDSDILFGKNLGMKTVLIRSAEITNEKADYTVNSLAELKDII
jgi:D-glycero-D-manno-heptose 1,7-bisphosphate phosphatase